MDSVGLNREECKKFGEKSDRGVMEELEECGKWQWISKNACILRNSQQKIKLDITKQDALLLRPRK